MTLDSKQEKRVPSQFEGAAFSRMVQKVAVNEYVEDANHDITCLQKGNEKSKLDAGTRST